MQVTKQSVRNALIVATTMTKGVPLSQVTGDMVDAWYAKAASHGMTDEGFLAAFDRATDASTFFPSWHEVLAEYRKAEADTAHLILDPVKTGEHMQVDEIGSRERREALGLPYTELREESPQELPSPEVRESALARLESLENRAVKRMPKPSRERAEFDPSPDPEAQERARRMVEDARREA